MRMFGIALCLLFILVMGYAWQHFRAIEYGYRIEALRSQRDGLVGMNQALRLEEASLRDPERIDAMARKLGMRAPDPGQVIRMEDNSDLGAPVMASAAPVSVVSAR
jgi:cell division protein FtsL